MRPARKVLGFAGLILALASYAYGATTPESWPRRMKIDSQGIVWFCEYEAGKIGRFDPKTETFKEYPLPGGRPTSYALAINKKTDHFWFSSMEMDTVSEMDPATGKITQYPFLFSEYGMRDFFQDSDGRTWFGSHANNRVGYFYLAGSGTSQRAIKRNGPPSRAARMGHYL